MENNGLSSKIKALKTSTKNNKYFFFLGTCQVGICKSTIRTQRIAKIKKRAGETERYKFGYGFY